MAGLFIEGEKLMIIVIATHNRDKFYELERLLQVDGIEFIPAVAFNLDPVEETGTTFEENAKLKAKHVANMTGYPAIGEDSGMCIPVLNGYPGIYSARCSGDEDSCQHILKKMAGQIDRRASFICAMALAMPYKIDVTCFKGECNGELTEEVKGLADSGLQYDSIFYMPELKKTFAEVSKEQKHKLSHRSHAAKNMRAYIKDMF